jgi:hypothetical protein
VTQEHRSTCSCALSGSLSTFLRHVEHVLANYEDADVSRSSGLPGVFGYFRCRCPFHRLREQRHGVGDAPAQDIRCAQGRSHRGEYLRAVRFLTAAYGPFEQEECPPQVALAKG